MRSYIFAENFNDASYSVSKPASSKTVKRDEFLHSLNETQVLNAIQNTKTSSAITSDNFPSKILHLCPILFATILFPLISSITLTCTFPSIWKISYIYPMYQSAAKSDIVN